MPKPETERGEPAVPLCPDDFRLKEEQRARVRLRCQQRRPQRLNEVKTPLLGAPVILELTTHQRCLQPRWKARGLNRRCAWNRQSRLRHSGLLGR